MALQRFHCCYHCKTRTESCHGSCEMYKQEVLEDKIIKEQHREQHREQKEINRTVSTLNIHRKKRMSHRKGII